MPGNNQRESARFSVHILSIFCLLSLQHNQLPFSFFIHLHCCVCHYNMQTAQAASEVKLRPVTNALMLLCNVTAASATTATISVWLTHFPWSPHIRPDSSKISEKMSRQLKHVCLLDCH